MDSGLAASFTDPTTVHIGRVEYVDYRSTFIPEHSIYPAFLCKRISFEYEREVRALITEFPPSDGAGLGAHSPDVWDVGRYCQIELGQLIHEVVVSPLSPEWFIQLVQSVASKYGLRSPVRRSSLADVPPQGYRPNRFGRAL